MKYLLLLALSSCAVYHPPADPVALPSAAPAPVVAAFVQGHEVCRALREWDPAAETIVLSMSRWTVYTFSSSGVFKTTPREGTVPVCYDDIQTQSCVVDVDDGKVVGVI